VTGGKRKTPGGGRALSAAPLLLLSTHACRPGPDPEHLFEKIGLQIKIKVIQ